ncbi:MAG TPA: aldo/keto reductase [Nitrososphaera sp.]|jgi:aryl-alcohol dehydrogenase-like predicted oxidoreductase|nr:aldo/keto reductase [Nitrososphaera sp.]
MKYRTLGKSGLKVSEIGFGAWTIALDWWGKKVDDDEAIRMLKRAYDLGITFYETADLYGKGKSEKLIAQAFKDMRNDVIYSTKWGYDMYNAEQIGHSELPQKHNSEFLQFALSQSLDRLQTNYLDVYSLHNPKMDAIQNDNLFSSLDTLVKKGIIKSHGVALGPAIGWKDEGLEAVEKRNITCLQTVYNILEQDPARDFMQSAEQRNVGIMVRVPDASGLLTGKVNSNTKFDKNDHRSYRKQEFILEAMQKIEKMRPLANSKGWTITELAIKFILSHRQISVILPTMTNIEEIELFASLSDGKYLNSTEIASMEEMYEKNFYVEPIAK